MSRLIPYLNPENKEQASANWRKVEAILGITLPCITDRDYLVRLNIDQNVAPDSLRLETKLKTQSAWKVRQAWPLVVFKHIQADYVLTGNESVIIVDNAGGTALITLPAAANASSSRYTVIQKSALVTVTLAAAAGETVNGGATVALPNTAFIGRDVVCDGVEWYAF
ncbi:MAG: hypothetical protein A2Y38_19250 [Spirochaetes bacterium GWB1_59_5]|nr:MAG: hypothetical protein A2Y38_19250 [Spirochaetes bacterium GWB1_59_5]